MFLLHFGLFPNETLWSYADKMCRKVQWDDEMKKLSGVKWGADWISYYYNIIFLLCCYKIKNTVQCSDNVFANIYNNAVLYIIYNVLSGALTNYNILTHTHTHTHTHTAYMYTHTHTHTCIHTHTHTCIHMHTNTHACTHAHTNTQHTCTHTHTHTYMYTHTCACTCMYRHVHTRTRTHTHACTHAHTHTHTHRCRLLILTGATMRKERFAVSWFFVSFLQHDVEDVQQQVQGACFDTEYAGKYVPVTTVRLIASFIHCFMFSTQNMLASTCLSLLSDSQHHSFIVSCLAHRICWQVRACH